MRLTADGMLSVRVNEWLFLRGGLEPRRRLRDRWRGDGQIRVGLFKAFLYRVLKPRPARMPQTRLGAV